MSTCALFGKVKNNNGDLVEGKLYNDLSSIAPSIKDKIYSKILSDTFQDTFVVSLAKDNFGEITVEEALKNSKELRQIADKDKVIVYPNDIYLHSKQINDNIEGLKYKIFLSSKNSNLSPNQSTLVEKILF